jgi:hypothetical protein
MLSAFFGFIIWMMAFIFLTSLSTSLRVRLPVKPVFAAESRGRETASCQACGGGIECDTGDFACLCSYCNVEYFRGQFVRRERMQGKHRRRTQSLCSLAPWRFLKILPGHSFSSRSFSSALLFCRWASTRSGICSKAQAGFYASTLSCNSCEQFRPSLIVRVSIQTTRLSTSAGSNSCLLVQSVFSEGTGNHLSRQSKPIGFWPEPDETS